jgi:16S rRNA (adenine1518-N6/adenine1519-N6)-dimethyltransferase
MPTRRYGQHFLTNQSIVAKIAAGAGVSADDAVLEIGPGRGILTRALAAAAKKVLTVEIDRRLHALLVEDGLPPNVELLRGDALALQPAELTAKLGADWKLVANLPYEITSKTLEKFLPMRAETGHGPTSVTLMLQREVGERILAKAGDMNRLALFCGYYAEPRLLFSVPRGAFSPPPKVDSCVIRLDIRSATPLSGNEEALFFRLISTAFAAKRKQIKNTIGTMLGPSAAARLAAAGLSPEARPEEITLNQWVTLARGM